MSESQEISRLRDENSRLRDKAKQQEENAHLREEISRLRQTTHPASGGYGFVGGGGSSGGSLGGCFDAWGGGGRYGGDARGGDGRQPFSQIPSWALGGGGGGAHRTFEPRGNHAALRPLPQQNTKRFQCPHKGCTSTGSNKANLQRHLQAKHQGKDPDAIIKKDPDAIIIIDPESDDEHDFDAHRLSDDAHQLPDKDAAWPASLHWNAFQQTELSKGLAVDKRLEKWKVYKTQYSHLSAAQRSLLWTADCKAMPKGKGEGKGKKEGGRSGGGDHDAAPAAKNGGKGKNEGGRFVTSVDGPDKTKRSMTQTKKRAAEFDFKGSDDESDPGRQTRSASRAQLRKAPGRNEQGKRRYSRLSQPDSD